MTRQGVGGAPRISRSTGNHTTYIRTSHNSKEKDKTQKKKHEHNTEHKTQGTRRKNTKHTTKHTNARKTNTKHKTQYTKHERQNTKRKTQNTRLETKYTKFLRKWYHLKQTCKHIIHLSLPLPFIHALDPAPLDLALYHLFFTRHPSIFKLTSDPSTLKLTCKTNWLFE